MNEYKMTPVRIMLFLWGLLCMCVSVGSVSELCKGSRCLELGESRPCSGSQCGSGRPTRQHNPLSRSRSAPTHQHAVSHLPSPDMLESHTASHSHTRERMRLAEVAGHTCSGADCITTKRPPQAINDTRECRGLECRLPLRIRTKPRVRPCPPDGCGPGSDDAPVHVPDRAAQFLGEFPDIGYPSSELGGAPLGVQLTCDIKPGGVNQWIQLFCPCLGLIFNLISPPLELSLLSNAPFFSPLLPVHTLFKLFSMHNWNTITFAHSHTHLFSCTWKACGTAAEGKSLAVARLEYFSALMSFHASFLASNCSLDRKREE